MSAECDLDLRTGDGSPESINNQNPQIGFAVLIDALLCLRAPCRVRLLALIAQACAGQFIQVSSGPKVP